MSYWNPISGVGNPIPIRKFDGVYKPDDEGFNLPENLFTELINFCPDEYPAITTRPGYSVIGSFGGGPVLGVGAYEASELHAVFSDGSWRKWDGTNWTTLATGLSTTAEWSFCNFKGNLSSINLIGTNGVDGAKRYDGSAVQTLANAPSGANYIDTQFNRLYCAVGNTVRFSALAKPEDWTEEGEAGAGEIPHETYDGETINGLKAGNGNVTVYKLSSVYELYGTGPTSYRLEKVAADIGANANKAITVKDDILPFISRDGLYQYAGGLRPKKEFSRAVDQFIVGTNRAHLPKSVAGTDGRYIYFGIPYNSATQVNRILQYDPIHGNWYTWDNIAVTQMIRIGADMYFGDASGRILRLGGTTDNGTAITATAVTIPFTLNSIARKQQWFKLWVVASVATGATLRIYVSTQPSGDSDWSLVKTFTASNDMRFEELLVPLNRIYGANCVRLKLESVGQVSIHEITRQIRELPMRR